MPLLSFIWATDQKKIYGDDRGYETHGEYKFLSVPEASNAIIVVKIYFCKVKLLGCSPQIFVRGNEDGRAELRMRGIY